MPRRITILIASIYWYWRSRLEVIGMWQAPMLLSGTIGVLMSGTALQPSHCRRGKPARTRGRSRTHRQTSLYTASFQQVSPSSQYPNPHLVTKCHQIRLTLRRLLRRRAPALGRGSDELLRTWFLFLPVQGHVCSTSNQRCKETYSWYYGQSLCVLLLSDAC